MATQAPARLVSRAEYAKLLGIHPGTLDRWARAGRVHVVRTPGAMRFVVEGELAEILAAQRSANEKGGDS